MRKLVRKSYTPVVPIANTCSIGYPHDSRADNAAYRHDRRADNAAYRHDRRADSLSRHSWYLFSCHSHESISDYSYSWELYVDTPVCLQDDHEPTCMRIEPV